MRRHHGEPAAQIRARTFFLIEAQSFSFAAFAVLVIRSVAVKAII
jgi:hypothetical protein